jgi:nitrous oxide reductase accessory protein NosL
MRKIAICLIWIVLFLMSGSILWALDNDVKEMPACKVCGMNRETFAQSRMLIEYSDGSKVGVCSLHCAAADMVLNLGKFPKAVWVADYYTRNLIDARTAVWVIGGRKPGVMTKNAKWAFGDKAAADNFVSANGGQIASFDEAMRLAYRETADENSAGHEGHGHAGHDHGSQLMLHPGFGDEIYHIHPAGMWMVGYKFMHMAKHGLGNGTDNIDQNSVSPVGNKPFGYMMTPTNMTMDMQMLMIMYGVTDKLTLMVMGNYQAMKMDMLMNMGMGNNNDPPMRMNGFGDTELTASYGIAKYFVVSLGLSIPTGSINETVSVMGTNYRAPYDMQLGSGTFDLKPSLTYNAVSDDSKWNWGAQASYIYHIGQNYADYSLGDSLKLTTWLKRAFGNANTWVRAAYTDTNRISGHDSQIDSTNNFAPLPDADPTNYGGQRLDALIGVGYQRGAVSFGVEGGIPVYEYVNGLQLRTDWMLTFGLQAMF